MSIFVESYTLQPGTPVATQEHMEKTSMRRNHILEQRYAAEKRQKDLDAFTSESKDFLLTEALSYVLRKCLPSNIDESLMVRGKAIAESFVKEEGSYSLLNRFKTKTLFLSELASIVEETHKKVIHGCEGKDTPFKIQNSDMKAFHDRLDTMNTDTLTTEIVKRVTKAEEEFVKANVKDKETLEKFHTLQSRLKTGFNALDIETEFMNSDSTEAGFYLKKLDEYLCKPANAVKKWLVKPEELVQRRNILIEKLKAENEEPVIVHYNAEIFQQVGIFRYDIERYADSIIAGIGKLHQIFDSSHKASLLEDGCDNISNSTQPKRTINEAELKEYFKLTFKGGGNGNIDYFTNNLLPDLKQNWSDKEFAKIALMIYESGKLIDSMRPNTFKAWYKRFCELVGCGSHEEYKPNKLGVDESFKRKFSYL